jgi:metal-responsive CopG/Arc/MetJ family transcriptional regulator
MQQITVRLPETMIEELDTEADERGVSRSEHVRSVLASRRDVDDLRDRLDAREERIDTLEEQLARRSQVEEKVDTLAKRVEDSDEPDPPWPIRWYRWMRA